MKHGHNRLPYRILAPAAQAALRFARRHDTPGRDGAWRPIPLFWRRPRKRLEGVRASRVALAVGAVWRPSFHLHFMIHMKESLWRRPMSRSFPFALNYQRRVVTAYGRAIFQSNVIAPQLHHGHRPEHVFLQQQALSGPGVSIQVVESYGNPSRRSAIPPAATPSSQRGHRQKYDFSLHDRPSGLDESVQTASIYKNTARRSVVLSTETWQTIRGRRPNLDRNHPGVHPGADVQMQTLQEVRTSRREPLLIRIRSKATDNAASQYSQESAAAAPNFHPQALIWRHAVPSATGIAGHDQQMNSPELTRLSPGHSFPGREAASELPRPFGHSPAAPALKIDSALMDRLTDDVIRRVERRTRIERARQGL